ncbi:MAG: LysR family transcriptional regulator, partial [Eubacteriales bacterium]|nr:LysR family transcriptional regulator [Eubacteriales bacterium]
MTTDQLESFIQVAENLNFARAAEILNITQSAVSRQIHALEAELGVKLLHRTTRTVTLTSAGVSFLDDAKNVIGRLKIAAARIQHNQSSGIQLLSIGCGNEADLALLGEILKVCREQLPNIHPFIRVIPHRAILNLFYQGEIDILFGFQDDIPPKEGIIYTELFQIPLCCLVSNTHPYAEKTHILENELFSEHIVSCNSYAMPSKAAEVQNRISQHLLPESVYICENMQVLLTLVRAGYGCAIVPQMHHAVIDITSIPFQNIEPLSYGMFYKSGIQDSL